MNPDDLYERRQTANRMEVTLLFASLIGAVGALLVLLAYGWLAGLFALIFSMVVFALSRLFYLVADLFLNLGRIEEDARRNRPPPAAPPTPTNAPIARSSSARPDHESPDGSAREGDAHRSHP